MKKLIIEEVRLTNLLQEVELDIVRDESTNFLSKEQSNRALVATENDFHSDVK